MRSTKRKPTHPGEVLREDVLPALHMTQGELAKRLGVSRLSVSELLHGRHSLPSSSSAAASAASSPRSTSLTLAPGASIPRRRTERTSCCTSSTASSTRTSSRRRR